jgi:hypothetical protein
MVRQKMSENKKHICPVFPDMICPQGKEMSEACTVRINGEFDPMVDLRDHLLLHCAIHQNGQQAKKLETDEN